MKKTWTGEYKFEGYLVGEVTASYEPRQPFRPGNTKFMCRRCGNVWGEVSFPLAEKCWHLAFVPCAEHGGGALHNDWQNNKFDYELSAEVLRHDFIVLFDSWTKPDHAYATLSIPVELGGKLN